MNTTTKKYLAELIGTAVLVLIGCGSVAIGGYGPDFPLGMLPVALAFGLAVFVGGTALAQVWLFLVVPLIGGIDRRLGVPR